MKILEWNELENGKAYWKHHIDSGKTVMCRSSHMCGGRYRYLEVEGETIDEFASDFKDCVFVEIEEPSRSDWALAILQKDSQ